MIKILTLRNRIDSIYTPNLNREYYTAVQHGDLFKVFIKYNEWVAYWAHKGGYAAGVHEAHFVGKKMLLESFDITKVEYVKNKREFNEYKSKYYDVPVIGDKEMDIFDKLKQLKQKIDPYNTLRFHQFMYIINAEYYEFRYNRSYQVSAVMADQMLKVSTRDLFYEEDEEYKKFIDRKMEEE